VAGRDAQHRAIIANALDDRSASAAKPPNLLDQLLFAEGHSDNIPRQNSGATGTLARPA
jgi:hypothetical protein